MIKKDYFSTQEAPDWVKQNVMDSIGSRKGKTFRLFYIMKHKSLAVVFMFIFVVVGSYLYVNNSDVSVIPRNTNSDSKLNKNTINDLDANISLQKKIVETEAELDNLYDNLSKDISVTF